jgi:hypothetical protein
LNLTEAANALFAAIDFNRHIISKCAQPSHYIQSNSPDKYETKLHSLYHFILLSARKEMPYNLNCIIIIIIIIIINNYQPIPVAARSKAWVCGRSLAGIAGSNPAGDKEVFVL